MHKLNTEFKELKNSRTGKIFLQNIVVCIYIDNFHESSNTNFQIETFSIGKECPTFSDITLVQQERDERHLIKV